MDRLSEEIKSSASGFRKLLIWDQISGNLALGLLFGLSLFSPIVYTWLEIKVSPGIQIGLGLVSTTVFIIFLYLGIICYQSIKEDKWILKVMNIVQPIYLLLGGLNVLLYLLHRDQEIDFFNSQNIIKLSYLLVMGFIAFASHHIFNFRKD